jgi:hypothetical protein
VFRSEEFVVLRQYGLDVALVGGDIEMAISKILSPLSYFLYFFIVVLGPLDLLLKIIETDVCRDIVLPRLGQNATDILEHFNLQDCHSHFHELGQSLGVGVAVDVDDDLVACLPPHAHVLTRAVVLLHGFHFLISPFVGRKHSIAIFNLSAEFNHPMPVKFGEVDTAA